MFNFTRTRLVICLGSYRLLGTGLLWALVLSSPVVATEINVLDVGARGDGKSDDTQAIQTAIAALGLGGGTLRFPAGSYVVNATTLDRSHVTIEGEGPRRSILKVTRPGSYAFNLNQSSGAIEDVWIRGLGFEAAPGIDCKAVEIQENASRIRISECRFWDIAWGITFHSPRHVVVEDCRFEAPGFAPIGSSIECFGEGQDVLLQRNKFRFIHQGIHVKGTVTNLAVRDNHFDLGWWLLKETASGEGETVTYGTNSLRDTAGDLARFAFKHPAYGSGASSHNVRVMPERSRGQGRVSGRVLTDPTARFVESKIKNGEIVRIGSVFGVVDRVVSETELAVEEWLDRSDYQPTNPTSGAYTVFGILLGNLETATATDLTMHWDHWKDLDGNDVLPPSGTRYEVLPLRPNYPLIAGTISESAICNNVFLRGWCDQIYVFAGDDVLIAGNRIESGQDMGITVSETTRMRIVGNTIRRQGTSGICLARDRGQDIEGVQIVGNTVEDAQTYNTFPDYAGDIVVTGSRNFLAYNHCRRRFAQSYHGILVRASGMGVACENNTILGNVFSGHRTAGILLKADGWASITETRVEANQGTLVEQGSTGTKP